MSIAEKRGPSRHTPQKQPPGGGSPAGRQAARELAEAAALAELEAEVDARRKRSAQLRQLRVAETMKPITKKTVTAAGKAIKKATAKKSK